MKEILDAYAELKKDRDGLAEYKVRADQEFQRLLPLVKDQPNLFPPGTKVNISQLVEAYIHRLEAENKNFKESLSGYQREKDEERRTRVMANGETL